MNKDDSFLVVFDTSTIPDYYLDVHNVLALPSNSIIRYEYRSKYLSNDALNILSDDPIQILDVLFVYTQWDKYARGDVVPPPETPLDEMIWIPFRLGKLVNTNLTYGDIYNLDLMVGGYPNWNDVQIDEILSDAKENGNVPYRKWITLSPRTDLLNEISTGAGDNSVNWRKIIDLIGSPPSQFSGDAFWRVTSQFIAQNKVIQPTYKHHKGKDRVIQVDYLYELTEDNEYRIEISSYTPPDIDSRTEASFQNQRKLEIKSSSNEILFAKEDLISLRQYMSEIVEIRTEKIRGFFGKEVNLLINTVNGHQERIIGPKLGMKVFVKKNLFETIVGIILFLLGSIMLFLSDKIFPNDPNLAFWSQVIGVVCFLLGGYLLYRSIDINFGRGL